MALDPSERPVISRNIVRLRKARNLTQVQLAELSGLSKRMIAHYETNITNPPINNLTAIAKALHVSLLELLGESKPKEISFFGDIDMRIMKKALQIAKLSLKDRLTVYNMIDALSKKHVDLTVKEKAN
jgi:transcriptional regulator with XRE-family HTH domain